MRKPPGYWDVFENCYNEAKKYNTLRDFNAHSGNCAKSCRKHGWLEEFPWLVRLGEKRVAQYDLEGRLVGEYTNSLEAAKVVHGFGKEESTVSEIRSCCRGAAKTAYGFIWLFSTDMGRAEELIAERLKPVEYKPSKYTKEYCRELAMSCSTMKEFYTKYSRAHHISIENGWIDEFPWLKRVDRKEIRHDYSNKAVAQYTLDGKFIRMWESGTEAAIWLGDVKKVSKISCCCHLTRVKAFGYRWLFEKDMDRAEEIFATVKNKLNMKPGGYTKKEVVEEAAKYDTLKDFSEGSHYYYRAARRMGIINELNFKCRALNPYRDNTYCVYAYEFIETRYVYVGVTFEKEVRDRNHRSGKKCSGVYKYACENNLPIPSPKYLEENLSPLDAGELEDVWKKRYAEQGWGIINIGVTGRYSSSLGACRKVSNKKIIETASKYEYLKDFRENHKSLYSTARHRGLDLGFLKLSQKPSGTYNRDFCFIVASQYETVGEFREKDRAVYDKASSRGWLNEYTWLKGRNITGVCMDDGFTAESFGSWEITVFRTVKEATQACLGVKVKCSFEQLQDRAKNCGHYFYSLS